MRSGPYLDQGAFVSVGPDNKCKFHITETKYLGLIISMDGIKIDFAKDKAIQN